MNLKQKHCHLKYALTAFLCASIMVLGLITQAHAAQQTSAKQAIIVDYKTGNVLFEKNADQKMPTSSMSKVMSMYVIFDALKKGNLSLEDEFVISEKAWKKGGSKMFIEVGKKVKVEDLIRGVIVQSGNDATIALAEGLAGSEEMFANALNRKAKELGMDNSNFMNASGWPDENHYSTARDLAKLAKAMIEEFPEYYEFYSETEFTFNDIKQANRNPLLGAGIGADGLKTGHTDDGGYGLIGTGVNDDGRRVIMVLNGMESKKERREESIRLLQWGLNGFTNVVLFENKKTLDKAPVYLGQKSTVSLEAGDSVNILVSKINASDIEVELQYESPIKAPVKRGQKVGNILVKMPGVENPHIVPLLAAENIAELDWFMRIVQKARLLTTGKGDL